MFKNTINKVFIVFLIISIFLLPISSSYAIGNNKTHNTLEIPSNHIKVAATENEEDSVSTDNDPIQESNEDVEFVDPTSVVSDEQTSNDNEQNLEQENSTEENSDESIENNENNTKIGDVYLSGQTVKVDYNIDGNLFIIANNVTISSQISGDAFIMANSITIEENAYIYNNLFSCSKTLDIKGVVYDLYALSQNINLINAYIDRDFRASCENLNLIADIGRNAFINCKTLVLENQSEGTYSTIAGNLTYSAEKELENIPEYIVSGDTKFTPTVFNNNSSISDYILSVITALCFVSLIWLCLSWLSPKFLSSTNKLIKEKKGFILVSGICTLILIPILSIVFIMTNVLSSFALFLLILYFAIISLSTAIFAISINNLICDKFKINKKVTIWGILLLTRLALWIINLIPVIGSLVTIITTLCGIGIILSYILPPIGKGNKLNKEAV